MDVRTSPPKFQRVYEAIRTRILEGAYPAGSRLPSENRLPIEFGVGKQTVVRAMSELAREGLVVRRQGVGTFVAEDSTRALALSLSPHGRPLRVGLLCRRSIGLQQVAEGTWQGCIARGVAVGLGMPSQELRLKALGGTRREATRVRMEHAESPHTLEFIGEAWTADDEAPPLEAVLSSELDAVATISIFNDVFLDALARAAAQRCLPLVLVDYWTRTLGARCDCVAADNLPGYLDAANWFLSQGRRRIHFVGAYVASSCRGAYSPQEARALGVPFTGRVEPDSYVRLATYRQAMEESGLEVPASWIHHCVPSEDCSAQLAEQLWALDEKERPEAVVCHSALTANVILRHFHENGCPLEGAGAGPPGHPGPCRLIQFDPDPMGRIAASLLLNRLDEFHRQAPPRPPVKAGVPTRFIAKER